MDSTGSVDFFPFKLDTTNECVIRFNGENASSIRLRPKTFAVLCYLLERCPDLVTKTQLLEALWPGTWVTDSALKSCIRELRAALDDDPQRPRFIETVHRRGYRFIGKKVSRAQPRAGEEHCGHEGERKHQRTNSGCSSPVVHRYASPFAVVGREAELTRLHALFASTLTSERHVVFITGEAGIGKTALVDAFLSQIQTHESISIGWSQCVEHYGAGEPYRPIIEALSWLSHTLAGQTLQAVIRQLAPTWLSHIPMLFGANESSTQPNLRPQPSHERMIREMTDSLEVLSQTTPVLLVLEDLHWSDYSTIELLATLARRRGPARLMIVATYRTNETCNAPPPIQNVCDELQLHGVSDNLLLNFLTPHDIKDYLSQRFPTHRLPALLAVMLHRQSEGNPLFMANIVDELIRQNRIVTVDGCATFVGPLTTDTLNISETLTRFLARQIDALDEVTQRLLMVASVVGTGFSSALLATLLSEDIEKIETICDNLAQHGRLLSSSEAVEWQNGKLAVNYRFSHALYRDICYQRLGRNQRVRFHAQVARQLESLYGRQVNEVASEVALHFERGGDTDRAAHYHYYAGENALRRSAAREAIDHFDNAVRLVGKMSPTVQRRERELALQVARAAPLAMVHGYGAPIVAAAYERAQALSHHVGQTSRRFSILAGLNSVYHMQGKLRQAHALEHQLLRIARHAKSQTLLLWTYIFQGMTAYHRGELLRAEKRIKAGLPLYVPQHHTPRVSSGREDPGLLGLITLVSILWLRGYPDEALRTLQEAQRLAEHAADPVSHAMVLGQTAVLYQRRREETSAFAAADALFTFAQEHGFAFRAATALIYRGWALVKMGEVIAGIPQIREGLDAVEAHGAILARPYYLALLGDAYDTAGQIPEALLAVQQALTLAQTNEDRCYEAELWRLQAVFIRKANGQRNLDVTTNNQVEEYLQRALTVAQQQRALSLELRVRLSLSTLWAEHGRVEDAYRLLDYGYRCLTEGWDTVDGIEAQQRLQHLRKHCRL